MGVYRCQHQRMAPAVREHPGARPAPLEVLTMRNGNDACRVLEPADGTLVTEPAFEPEPGVGEGEPWIILYYEQRGDAFAAAEAADLLGLSWHLSPRLPDDEDLGSRQWIV